MKVTRQCSVLHIVFSMFKRRNARVKMTVRYPAATVTSISSQTYFRYALT